MKKEEFNKGIKEFHEMRLTHTEQAAMLQHALSTPIESPYVHSSSVFAFLQRPMAFALTLCLLFVTGSALAYTAEDSLPGEVLYPIKTKVIEPILDRVNTTPVEKLVWEEKKVERRIMEAEALSSQNKLDEGKTRELERKIEKSSAAFAVAAEASASSTATTTESRKETVEKLKQGFRDKLNASKVKAEETKKVSEKVQEVKKENDEKKSEKIQRLKASAVKALESEKDNNQNKGNSGKGNREED